MIGDIKKFRFWCQKVLPLVYDNSLSYYEVLCKVVQYLNGLIDDVNKIPDYIDSKIEEALTDEHIIELLSQFIVKIQSAISANNEGTNVHSSKDYSVGQMLWLNDTLYRVIRPISAGATFIVNTNIEAVDFETLFNGFVDEVKHDITANDDGTSATATQSWTAGQWVWLNDELYEVVSDITQGNAYVFSGDNANVHQITVDDMLHQEVSSRIYNDTLLNELISDLNNKVGTLDELQTIDKSNIVNAINEIVDELSALKVVKKYNNVDDMIADTTLSDGDIAYCGGYHSAGDGGALHYLISNSNLGHGISLTTLYANPIFPSIVTPEMFGAYGDDTHDDATAIQNALNYSNNLHFNSKTYLCNTEIQVAGGSTITGESGTIIKFASQIGFKLLGQLVIINNLNIECTQSRANNTIAIYDGGNTRVARSRFANLWLRSWTKGFSLNGGYNDNMIIDNIEFSLVNNCIEIYHGDATKITNIVAEPFINYVVAGVYCNGMTIENVIATGERDAYTDNPSVAFILLSDGSADKKLGINIKIDTVFCERVNYVVKSDCPYVEFNNIYVNESYAVQNAFQIHNGFSGVPNANIMISNCWCTNYTGEFLYTLDGSPNEMIGDVRYRAAVGRPNVSIINSDTVTYTARANAPAPVISNKNGTGVPVYSTSDLPASPFLGQVVFDSTTNTLKTYNGTAWV